MEFGDEQALQFRLRPTPSFALNCFVDLVDGLLHRQFPRSLEEDADVVGVFDGHSDHVVVVSLELVDRQRVLAGVGDVDGLFDDVVLAVLDFDF